MNELPEFGSTKVCPKCGGEQMFRKYRTQRASQNPLDPTTVEYMQVMCGGCGFDQMTEKTKDAPLSV
ncbi:MAG TPA: hypothetical protein VGP89_17855 [Candidatus Angelobacter sp.]|jgi:uncharacterized protein (DUF983 family)|nr:hypothetical protein [Candidatus Angelobacter sp.]